MSASSLQRQIGIRKVLGHRVDLDSIILLVLAQQDPALQSHQVNLAYYLASNRLHQAFNSPCGCDPDEGDLVTHASWFSFAVWATASVGRNIRSDFLPRRVTYLLPGPLRELLTPTLLNLRSSGDYEVARALNAGQMRVFTSVFSALARVLKLREATKRELRKAFDASQPEPEHRSDRLQAELRLAEEAYSLAAFLVEATNTPSRNNTQKGVAALHHEVIGNLCLLGTLVIAAIEQKILDSPVSRVIEHVPRLAIDSMQSRAEVVGQRYLGLERQVSRLAVGRRFDSVSDTATAIWSRLLTDQILVVSMPGELVRVGKDLQPRSAGGRFYPPHLTVLSDRASAEAVYVGGVDEPVRFRLERMSGGARLHRGIPASAPSTLLAKSSEVFDLLDRSQGEGVGSAAWDWRRYEERVSFGASFIRSRFDDRTLFWSPYTREDIDRLIRNEYPVRNGDPFDRQILFETDKGTREV